MSSSGESRAKSRGKRNSTNLEECPNYPIEYERLELHRKCPRFVKLISNEDGKVALDDLDSFQVELEIILTDSMKRLRLLKNELKPIDHRQNRIYEERLKKLKDMNYERYQQSLNISKNSFMVSPSITNETPYRFWKYTKSFELNPTDLEPFSKYLQSSTITNNKNDLLPIDKEQSSEEGKELLDFVMKTVKDAPPKSSKNANHKSPKLGLFTQRLISSVVPSKKNGKILKAMQDTLERNKLSTQRQVKCIEKTIYHNLLDINMVSDQRWADKSKDKLNCGILGKLSHAHELQSKENQSRLEILMKHAKGEVARQKMQSQLQALQIDLIETYQGLHAAKVSESNAQYVILKNRFHLLVERQTRLVSLLNSLPEQIDDSQ